MTAAPLHMAMWGHGRLDVDEGSIIDAIVAIPAYTLSMAGLCGLPEDFMLQIGAQGSAYSPSIDWLRCSNMIQFKKLVCPASMCELITFSTPLIQQLERACSIKLVPNRREIHAITLVQAGTSIAEIWMPKANIRECR